jgi:GTP-binding protein EngB required for normal cell division
MLGPVRRFVNLLESAVDVPPAFKGVGFDQQSFNTFKAEVLGRFYSPPKIALIGETGVGKSSTINALFNLGQEISHRPSSTCRASARTSRRTPSTT